MTAEDMAHLHAACFTVPRPWSTAEFTSLLSDPLTLILTESQGFLVGRVVADEAEVLTLAVDPAARRRGIGKSLLQEFLARAKAMGAVSVFLEVADGNDAACALYLSAGFSLQGRRKTYYRNSTGRGVDALVMMRAEPGQD